MTTHPSTAAQFTPSEHDPSEHDDPPEQDRFCEVAAYLQQVRLEQGLKITDVAQLSALSPQMIQAIEAGDFRSIPEALPSGVCIQRYADALGLKGAEVASGLSRRASAR